LFEGLTDEESATAQRARASMGALREVFRKRIVFVASMPSPSTTLVTSNYANP
jgi:hypothetical protein